MLPGPGGVAAAADLVALEAVDRADQQARVAVGPQRGVDVEQLAGGGAQRQPGDQLANEVAVDLLRTVAIIGTGLVGVVVEKHHIEVAAVTQLFATQLAVGDDGEVGRLAVVLAQPRPGPAQHAIQGGVGQRRQIIGHLLDRDQALDVAHQGAEDLGMVGMAQRVQQRVFVVLTGAAPSAVAVFEVGDVLGGVKALVQQPLVGQFVDHAGVAHQVLHRPARQSQQAQQPAHHLGAFDQQGQVAVATQQGFEPVDETQRAVFGAVAVGHAGAGALDQHAQAQLGFVAQRAHPRLVAPLAHAFGQAGRQRVEQGVVVDRQRPGAAALAVAAVACPVGRRRPAVVQQRVELGGHQFADLAQAVEQRTGPRRAVPSGPAPLGGWLPQGGQGAVRGPRRAVPSGPARHGGWLLQATHGAVQFISRAGTQAQRQRDPVQVAVGGGQQMGLLVVEVLDAVFDLAQEDIGRVELGGGVGLHQAAGGQLVQAFLR